MVSFGLRLGAIAILIFFVDFQIALSTYKLDYQNK